MNQEKIEELVNTAKAIERTARLSAMDDINTKLSNKLRLYKNLIYSDEAINIYFSTYGKKYQRLCELRRSLQTKERLLEEIGGMIWEMRYNEITNKKH